MGVAERKVRERAEREASIVAKARSIAEQDGWSAVTVRRLAEEIEYSQPVLYSHFESRTAVVGAVALQGLRELALALRAAPGTTTDPHDALEVVAEAYLAFAFKHPALYEAMFVLPTDLRFGQGDHRPELRAAFESLAAVLTPFSSDLEVATETLWATLHGLAELERSGRIRPKARAARLRRVIDGFTGSRARRTEAR